MKRMAFFLWLFVLLIIILSGCENVESNHNPKDKTPPINDQPVVTLNNIKDNLPLPINHGVLDRIFGWAGEHSILYNTLDQGISNIYTYNLLEGKNHFITKMESQIDSIDISHNGKYVLVRSSYGVNETMISVFNQEGEKVFFQELNVFDVYINWNPYNEDQILISTFTDQWLAETYILTISKRTMTKIEVSSPFDYWLNENEIVYQSPIQVESPSQIIKFNLNNGEESKILDEVSYLDTYKNLLLTIKKMDQKVEYYFYNNSMESVRTFTTMLLANNADIDIPNNDFIENSNTFLTFEQSNKQEGDATGNDSSLYKYDLKTGDKQLVLQGINNEPISCSSEGNICLYGYNFEKIIDINKKEMLQIKY